jgi:hypothetical protein
MAPLLALALALSPLAPTPAWAQGDAGFEMNDLGGTVTLPRGYASELWTDAELKAKHPQGRIFKLWMHPWQVAVDEDASKAWADRVKAGLEAEGVKEVGLTKREVVEIGGRKTAWMAYELSISGGRGVAYAAAFTGEGSTVFLRIVAAKRGARQAEADLRATLEGLALKKGPLDTGTGAVESAAGFTAQLPDGWRAPLRDELDLVRKVTAKVGEEGLSPDDCWVGVRPPPTGDPDVIFACRSQYYVGPLDDHSFEGVEAEVHERWFGRAEKPVPTAGKVDVGDRIGLYYMPPVAANPVRLALAPFDGGMMVMWGLAGQLDESGLDKAMNDILPTVAFTGPDGGAPIIGADKRVAYYLKYRPTSPLVLGPGLALLALVGGGIVLARRKSPDLDDD